MEVVRFIFDGERERRLDAVLLEYVNRELSESAQTRSQLKKSIERGEVSVEGKVVRKAGTLVRPRSKIEYTLAESGPETLVPYDFALDIIFEDKEILVLNKPPGISVHPGAGEKRKTLANAVVHYLKRKENTLVRGGIVHRLDMDTSGVLVVAKTKRSHASLSKQFRDRTVVKFYTALVFSTPRSVRPINKADSGIIDSKLGRHASKKTEMAVRPEGRSAITKWKVIERMSYGTLLSIGIETGRTHQIRVHMTSIGSPVIGDRTYGDFSGLPAPLKREGEKLGRQALHARTLTFSHPSTKKRLTFEAPVPRDMENLISVFRKFKGV